MADLSKRRIFEDAFRSYYGRTVSFVEKYCRDKNIAEDIAQNTFVTIWNNLDEISVDKPLLPLILTIAKNKACNWLRQEKTKEKYRDFIEKRDLDARYKALDSETLSMIYRKEASEAVGKAMAEMKENVRITFRMSRFDNMKNYEIAKKLNVSVKTVEYRMASALRILKKNLRDFISFIVLFIG
ncbi:MAG: RNA polymerase sigma-70 factor [Bacteroidales bacterium]